MPRVEHLIAPFLAAALLCACDSAKENSAPKAAAAAKTSDKKPEPKADAKPADAEPAAKPEGAEPEKAEAPKEAKAPEKPRVEFPALPTDAVELKLETMGGQFKVAKGTKLGMNINGWQSVEGADGFAMVIRESFDEMDAIKKEIGEVEYVVEEPDTLVYKKDAGFGFVAIVEAKGPEELEGEADRRFECRAGSSKEWVLSKKPKHFPRETVDLMVATCRSLEIMQYED